MPDMTWSATFEEVLRRHLPLAAEIIQPDDVLADLGLDSLGTVGLVMALEDTLDISIPDEALITETFRTAESLWAAIADLARERTH